MCGSVDMVGSKGTGFWRCRSSVIDIKFAGFEFRNFKLFFIIGVTLGKGRTICKGDAGGLILGI